MNHVAIFDDVLFAFGPDEALVLRLLEAAGSPVRQGGRQEGVGGGVGDDCNEGKRRPKNGARQNVHQCVAADSLRPDKLLLKVCVNDAGRLRRQGPALHRPRPRFLGACGGQ